MRAAGDVDGELEQLHKVIGLNPTDPAAHNDLGVALTKIGDFTGASCAFEKAIVMRGGHYPEALNNLGLVLMHTEREPEAFSALSAACHLRPEDPNPRKNLAAVMKEKDEMVGLAHSMWEHEENRRRHTEHERVKQEARGAQREEMEHRQEMQRVHMRNVTCARLSLAAEMPCCSNTMLGFMQRTSRLLHPLSPLLQMALLVPQ